MTRPNSIRKRDRLKRLLPRRARFAVFASIPAIAVAGFAPASPVDAGAEMPREIALRVGDAVPETPSPIDLSVLAEPAREELTPVEASFYGKRFAGRPTANGEIFDPSAMTAAHKTLPFGTMVEVTNVSNGKTVTVRINDRGPFHGNRAIDLSRKAAEEIGLIARGVGTVTMRVIS